MTYRRNEPSDWGRGRLAVAAFLLLCTPPVVSACSFVRVSCNFLDEKSSAIFIGTVLPPEVEPPGSQYPVVSFTVTEQLRGDVGTRVQVYQPGTSCDFPFRVGESYLVFANTHQGRLVTSELTSTQPVQTAGALVHQLRALKEGQHSAALFGILLAHNGPHSSAPLPAATVQAFSKGKRFVTKTNPDGTFEFPALPPGVYRVAADLPKKFVLAQTHPAAVTAGGSCDAGALWTTADGWISGRVLNSAMKPQTGFLTVFPAAGDSKDFLGGVDVGKNGKFELGPLPPGRYRLDFRAQGHLQTPFYFPEKTPQHDEAIELGEAEHRANVSLVLH